MQRSRGRGVDGEPPQVLLRVPDRLLLTVKAAEARPAVAATLQRARAAGVHRNSGTMALACALTDASPECFYQPYRDVLPTSVDHLPLFWSAEDISLLAGTPLADEIEDRRGAIEADCDALGLMDPEPRRAFQVAEALVLSRAFDFDEGRKRAMVPFADLLNSNRHTRRHVDFSYRPAWTGRASTPRPRRGRTRAVLVHGRSTLRPRRHGRSASRPRRRGRSAAAASRTIRHRGRGVMDVVAAAPARSVLYAGTRTTRTSCARSATAQRARR